MNFINSLLRFLWTFKWVILILVILIAFLFFPRVRTVIGKITKPADGGQTSKTPDTAVVDSSTIKLVEAMQEQNKLLQDQIDELKKEKARAQQSEETTTTVVIKEVKVPVQVVVKKPSDNVKTGVVLKNVVDTRDQATATQPKTVTVKVDKDFIEPKTSGYTLKKTIHWTQDENGQWVQTTKTY